MYSWIWRHIPFRQPQLKALVSFALIVALGALLWFKIFPLVEPILPFYDGQIENSNGSPADGGGSAPADNVQSPGPSALPSLSPATRPSR
jgi:hypothetical protein